MRDLASTAELLFRFQRLAFGLMLTILGLVRAAEDTAIIIPRGAVSEDRVMVIAADGSIESRAVEIAYYIEGEHPGLVDAETQWAVLAGGLRAGERIAVSNLTKLRQGMRVEGVDASASAGSER